MNDQGLATLSENPIKSIWTRVRGSGDVVKSSDAVGVPFLPQLVSPCSLSAVIQTLSANQPLLKIMRKAKTLLLVTSRSSQSRDPQRDWVDASKITSQAW